MSDASSLDLHPRDGARFVFEREDEGDGSPEYRVDIYLPEARRVGGRLSWDGEGAAVLQLDDPAPSEDDAWVRDGGLKLARVLKRDPKQRIVRWREA